MSDRSRFIGGVVVSIVLLSALVAFVDLRGVVDTLRTARPVPLAAALSLHLVILLLRVHRWLVIAEEGRKVERERRALGMDAVFLGWFANFALPAKAGDLARPMVYAKGSGRPFPTMLAAVAVERVLDLVLLGVSFGLAVALLPTPELPEWVRWAAAAAGSGALLVLAVLVVWRRLGPPLEGVPGRFRDGLALFDHPRATARAFGWTAVVWGLEGVAISLLMLACGASASASAALAVVVGTTLAVAAPSAPGQLGVSQWVILLVLAPYGVPEDVAVAISLLDTATVLFWVVPFGLVAMARRAARKPEPS